MSFKDVPNIKIDYKTLSDDVVDAFYIPVLSEAVIYKRAVGFFSSNILLQLTKGLGKFIANGGKMKLLVSPQLSKEDYDAIKNGYDAKQYVADKLNKEFDISAEFEQKSDRLGLLSYLISSGILDIKVAILEENSDNAMYHEKVGIMKDKNDNTIAFTGSANETYNGYNLNYESIDVYCSWKSEESSMRCDSKEMAFDRIWHGSEKGLITIPFPQIIKEKILSFPPISSKEDIVKIDENWKKKYDKKKDLPKDPTASGVNFFDYQKEAIDNWEKEDFRGIFDMATGTGKTFTGIGAICRLFEKKKRCVVFICCPFTHLVDQWCDELVPFNIDPIKCYGSIDYEKKLKRELLNFKQRITNFVCVVICNGSFVKQSIQELVQINLNDTLLVVDEAHNFGADKLSKCLNVDYPYRLALSATLERYGDEEGTAKLFNFFGKKCQEYSLDEAIKKGALTKYVYHPIFVYLTPEELDTYFELSKEIGKWMQRCKKGELSEQVKRLLLRRARLVAGASNKITALKEVLMNYRNEHNMLIYCGAVKYGQEGYDDATEEKKQIQRVVEMVNGELRIDAVKFTSEENTEQRKIRLNAFKNNEIQALVAIKCLDEGMNVPAIKTAFILASSTNPKEYIQRRGRVLRKFPGKTQAEIYDFITLPRPLDEVFGLGEDAIKIDLSLIRKELARMDDFNNSSCKPSVGNKLQDDIANAYDLNVIREGEEDYA